MGNSTTTLQSVVDYARTFNEIFPVLNTGGFSLQPALTIANDTMTALLARRFNWKWNRFPIPVFYTNSYQQDYASPVVNLSWIEHAFIVDINNTAIPKPIWVLEANKDLERTFVQYGMPGQVCWLPNDQLTYTMWAANTTYGKLLGVPSGPSNPIMQIQDPNGAFWIVSNNLTQNVTTGSSQPAWTNPALFPTPTNPTQAASTVTDGTVTWTAVNPKGQGFRLNPLPPQTGVIYQVNAIGQMLTPMFTKMSQTLEPIPDDYAAYFRQGFVAHCYRHSTEAKIRAKFRDEYQLWISALQDSQEKGDREADNKGFYPSNGIMGTGYTIDVGPAWPYGGFPGV